ncbi:RNA-directed DNA polymerase (reversetranscriptase)-related family protein [Striga asiatica]|uniref:RNA-directed DNA polymerase (Reversetranscriptase)-related family protein n=1 Tax=Striga asiatica TaxID=4170 RepID=A0A5A7PGP9_STRAF|nr:RNA-directed DNA polymerase (reversetranscriptase)-related family protein [Striga asiatica]
MSARHPLMQSDGDMRLYRAGPNSNNCFSKVPWTRISSAFKMVLEADLQLVLIGSLAVDPGDGKAESFAWALVHIELGVAWLLANFWWAKGNTQSKGIHWLAWDKMNMPKSEGGLGFQDIKLSNKALILKQLWRLIEKPDLLMCKVLKGKYFPHGFVFDCKLNNGASWLWRSWASLLPVLSDQVNIVIKNGAKTKLNDCNWVPGLQKGSPNLRADVDGSLFLVKDLLLAGGVLWDSSLVRALFEDDVASLILQIKSLNPNDDDLWKCAFLDKGKFSVKKAYLFLLRAKISAGAVGECSRLAMGNKRARDRCWSLKIMGKVCGEAEETIEHTLFMRRRAQIVWQIAPVTWDKQKMAVSSFKEWWWWITTLNFKDTSEARIQLQWQQERWIIQTALKDWMDYNASNLKE